MQTLSIIIPVYNSEKTISILIQKIIKTFEGEKIEIILINDNSSDGSHFQCKKVYEENKNFVTYIKLSKNMGEHNAVMAGINNASGDWAIIMDDDFQNPPEESLRLFNFSKNSNYDVVYCNYKKKKHNFIRNLMSRINDKTVNLILNKPKNIYLSSFKCIKKKLYKHIINYKGPSPYIDGLILLASSNIGIFQSKHLSREKGNSGYTFLKLLKLYSNVFTNFSTIPIHLFSSSGILIALVGIIFIFFVIIEKIINPNIPAGYSTIISLIIFFSGLQLIFLGLIGEYVGKILRQVNNESQYFIDEMFKKTDDFNKG